MYSMQKPLWFINSHTGEETMTTYTGARKMFLTIEENGVDAWIAEATKRGQLL